MNLDERNRRRRLKVQQNEAQQRAEQRRPVVRAEDLEFEDKKIRKKISYEVWMEQKNKKKQDIDEACAAQRANQQADAEKRVQDREQMDKEWQKKDRIRLTKARRLAVLDRLQRRIMVDRHDTADLLKIKKEAAEQVDSDPHLKVLFTASIRTSLSFEGQAFFDKNLQGHCFSIENELSKITAAVGFLKEELQKKVRA
jgi:hypothetical protein